MGRIDLLCPVHDSGTVPARLHIPHILTPYRGEWQRALLVAWPKFILTAVEDIKTHWEGVEAHVRAARGPKVVPHGWGEKWKTGEVAGGSLSPGCLESCR